MHLRATRAAAASSRPRVGLVLGAGGITGIAWLIGALQALRDHTGWDPATADIVTGTSAGAVAAAVLTSDVDPASLLTYAEDEQALASAIRRATAGRASGGHGPAWPGSLALGVTGLLATSPRRRLRSLAGFLPSGRRPTDEIRGLTHDAVAAGWPSHTELWLHACDYATGQRVTFGRAGAPDADLADAVAASCAVPAYYRPVRIGDRRYVDGGLWSFTNADALVDQGCDVVIILSPFSSREHGSLLGTALYGPLRGATMLRLSRDAKLLREAGAQVVTVEPTAADLRAMGLNPMDRAPSRVVLETAVSSVAERAEELIAGIDLAPSRPAARGDRPPQAAAA
ncbi:MAG: patatin [Actinobacteria bacterium]|nr:MAG: patatin [Actinomycetota bacterium]